MGLTAGGVTTGTAPAVIQRTGTLFATAKSAAAMVFCCCDP
jgi:hypothetical protein